jgi:hypothetical protein
MPASRADRNFPKGATMNRALHDDPFDTRQINLHDPLQTPYWCKLFAVTEAHLTSAVETVGRRAEDVKVYLKREMQLHDAGAAAAE